MLNARKAAESIGVTMETVYKLCKCGKLAHYRLGPDGGAIRFRPEDIEAYIASCRVERATTKPKLALKHIKA